MVIQVGVNGEPDQAMRTSLGVEAWELMSSQGSMVIQVGVNGEPDQALRTSWGVGAREIPIPTIGDRDQW